jgi:hypothetical protein
MLTARGGSQGKGLVERGGLRGVRGARTRGASRKIAKEAKDIGSSQVDAVESEEPLDSQTVADSTRLWRKLYSKFQSPTCADVLRYARVRFG